MRRSFLAGLVWLLLLAVGAARASAVTVTISPGGVMTGTASAAFVHSGAATVTLGGCTTLGTWTSAAAAAYPIPFSARIAVASPADDTAGNFRLGCTSCRNGTLLCAFSCDGTSNVMAAGATTAGGITALRITRIRCTISSTTPRCSATLASSSGTAHGGGVDATYDNGPPSLTIDAPTGTNQNLGISGSTCTGTLPNGIATFTGPSSGALTYVASAQIS